MPLPAEATVSLPGFALAVSTSSFTVRAGRRLLTTSTFGIEATPCAGTKSRVGSKRSDRYRNWLLTIIPCVPISTV
ncbi:hypothetical protein D3C86_2040870 [compost metagenome]